MASSSASLSLSSPSTSLSQNWEHDVFPSFHGPDVRKSFLSHVLKEFRRKAINLFIDNEINRGEFIGHALEHAIRGSKIAIVLLSKNYASSSWCLDELVEIMKKESGQMVINIFYEVDPTDVKKQTGYFGEVFRNTCQCKGKEKTEIWRKALEGVATIAGYHSSNWDDEAVMIENIANDISKKLNHLTPSHDFDHLIGMGGHMQRMEQLLHLDLDEVRMIGIWGPLGIGKTTIARFLFNQVSSEFQHSAIMVNIRGSYPKPFPDEYDAQLQLQSQMLSLMINEKYVKISHLGVAQGRLGDRKVLLVLDDVDQSAQLNALAKNSEWFGRGSRIIITTKNRRLLEKHGVDQIYKVKYPPIDEALQMFCMYAFDQKSPRDGFAGLAREITSLVGNLPLGLKVMGSYFRGWSKEQWSMEIRRLRTDLNGEIESVLKFSYDALCEKEKYLFLHIANFFNNEYMEKVEAYLAESFVDVRQGLRVLAEKSLISIEYDRIRMHNLLAQLGKDIVRKQSICEPRQCRFLVDGIEICDELMNYTSVIGIDFKYRLKITKKTIKGMSSLQFLRVQSYSGHLNTIFSPGPLTYISPKLRLLHWSSFPMTYLPFSNNDLEFLVELNMPHSKLKKLWDRIKLLGNLKWIDLKESRNLKKLPNLSMATNLKELNLSGCLSLVKLPSSIGNAINLKKLNLFGCSSLVKLPSSIGNATSLQVLDLCKCSSLVKLPFSTGNLTNLDVLRLDLCLSLVELPSSIGNLHKLPRLSLRGCSKLKALPININMESLEWLDLTDCLLLKRFPELSTNIKYLKLVGTSIKEVPCSITSWSRLDTLHMLYSENLKEFPYIHNIITELHSSDLTIQEIGPWVRGLSRLQILNLKGMHKLVSLPQLPDSIRSLNLNGCSSLVSLPKLPDSLVDLYLNECSSLVSLSQLPDSLIHLDAENCESLEKLDCSFCTVIKESIFLKLVNCCKLNQEAIYLIIRNTFTLGYGLLYGYMVLPGKRVPECFTYRAYGSSVTVKLNQNPLPMSTIFKACILVNNKCKNSVAEGKPVCFSITSKKIIDCEFHVGNGYPMLMDHLFIFEFEAKEVTSTEFVFEFEYDMEIKECGVIHLLEHHVD